MVRARRTSSKLTEATSLPSCEVVPLSPPSTDSSLFGPNIGLISVSVLPQPVLCALPSSHQPKTSVWVQQVSVGWLSYADMGFWALCHSMYKDSLRRLCVLL
jgi:hypothetical protein